jgi:hypothetical protein
VFHAQGYARLVDSERKLGEITPSRSFSPERDGPAVRIQPGKEEDFRYLRGWLASSEWLDRLIAATEPEAAAGATLPCSPVLRFPGRAVATAGRRLLEWRGDPAPVRLGRS